ncbi:MAG: hypothetical protein KIS72_04565 [Luteimonas sp.]|nr:hypothetical protein [Luteimonas sp.]
MRFRRTAWAAIAAACLAASGCGSIASRTNALSHERILSKTGGVPGLSPADPNLVDRRAEGTNAWATRKDRSGRTRACAVNGGNLLSFGMTRPPVCQTR